MARWKLLISHPSVPVMLAAVALGLGVLIASGATWHWGFVLLGIGVQMLNEYGLHRFVFHLPPPRRQWAFDLLYQAHYGHHDFPTHPKLFFTPVWVAVPMLLVNLAVVYGIVWLLLPTQAMPLTAAIVLVGGVLTFLGYEWFHMTAHLSLRKSRLETYVTRLHNQHHFRDFTKWFHVSPGGEVIDRVMGTAIDRESLKRQQRIDFIRTLGLSPDDPRLIAARNRFSGRYDLSETEVRRAAQT